MLFLTYLQASYLLLRTTERQTAPGDLIGSALTRILGRGLGTNRAYNSEPILLNDVIERTDKVRETNRYLYIRANVFPI